MFDEVYEFGAGKTLTLRSRLVVANGGWDGARVWRAGIGVACSQASRSCVAAAPQAFVPKFLFLILPTGRFYLFKARVKSLLDAP